MRILHLSDTHGAHAQMGDLPAADIIVHSGDVGMAGTVEEVTDFLRWFLRLPYRHKIFVPGNHDCCLLGAKAGFVHSAHSRQIKLACLPSLNRRARGLPEGCHLLYNSGVEIDGVKFYGVPCFVEFAVTGEDDKYYASIPADTDILVTHQPPHGILDRAGKTNFGSRSLLARVREISPRLHLFGHIHDAYGEHRLGPTRFVNGAMMDEQYRLVHPPRVIEC